MKFGQHRRSALRGWRSGDGPEPVRSGVRSQGRFDEAKTGDLLLAVLAGMTCMASPPREAGAIALDGDGTSNVTMRARASSRLGTMAEQSTRPGDQPPSCAGSPADALATCCNVRFQVEYVL